MGNSLSYGPGRMGLGYNDYLVMQNDTLMLNQFLGKAIP